jgi:hypothetical protein
MTTRPASGAPAPEQAPPPTPAGHSRDRRGSPVPTAGMIATRIMELRTRRGLMIALIVMTIGFTAVFLFIRLLGHAFFPRTSPPAGGNQIFGVLAAGFLPTFGFIAAATLGCTAGSRDLTEGMFRPLPAGAVPGPDPGRSGDRCAAGRDRLHDPLRGMRLRRANRRH